MATQEELILPDPERCEPTTLEIKKESDQLSGLMDNGKRTTCSGKDMSELYRPKSIKEVREMEKLRMRERRAREKMKRDNDAILQELYRKKELLRKQKYRQRLKSKGEEENIMEPIVLLQVSDSPQALVSGIGDESKKASGKERSKRYRMKHAKELQEKNKQRMRQKRAEEKMKRENDALLQEIYRSKELLRKQRYRQKLKSKITVVS